MSSYLTSSPKPCSGGGFSKSKLFKRLSLLLSSMSLLILIILLVWFAFHPSAPQFSIQDSILYQFELSSQHLLTSNMMITLSCKNPNQHVGFYYHELVASASYNGEEITAHTSISDFYQSNDDVNILSVVLVGNSLPISPSFAFEMSFNRSLNGVLLLNVKMDGKVQWKVGLISGHYNLHVRCDTYLAYNKNSFSIDVVNLMPSSMCHTSV